jgi:hypothetical protein
MHNLPVGQGLIWRKLDTSGFEGWCSCGGEGDECESPYSLFRIPLPIRGQLESRVSGGPRADRIEDDEVETEFETPRYASQVLSRIV